ncbi:MAG TPA: SIMPL domain-containing protein, partial [Actinotalea sp.]|nr:SIMPL domain-containing protein [Actinotalea sp.]
MADPGFRPGGGVTTVGTGRVPVVPDMVLVRLAAESTDPDAAQAHRSAAAAATALADALAGAGV